MLLLSIILLNVSSTISNTPIFSLTQAQDWQMFQFMFGISATTIGSFLIIIVGLVGFMWKNILNRMDRIESKIG